MDININLYKVFFIVANTKNMNKAAEELCISQPAVTKSVKKLESQLGTTLFVRSSKGMSLTAEGEMLYDKVKSAFLVLEEAEKSFLEFQELKVGEVRIGISAVLTNIVLLEAVKEFSMKYPGVNIIINNGLTSDLLNELNKGKLDFVIFNEGDSNVPNIEKQKIRTLNYTFAIQKGSDRLKAPLIMQKKGSFTREFMDNFIKEHDYLCKPGITVVSQDLACVMASQGMGICFAFEELINKRFPKLEVLPNVPECKSDIFIATNKHSSNTFAAKTLIKMIKEKNIID